jgi:hypothetical protein
MRTRRREQVTDTEVGRYVDEVAEKIKAHLANVDGAQVTIIGETTKAALLLVEARKKYPDREREICSRAGIQFEGSRYYELLAVGAGRKTMAQIKDLTRSASVRSGIAVAPPSIRKV